MGRLEELTCSLANTAISDISNKSEPDMDNLNDLFEKTIGVFIYFLDIESVAYLDLFCRFFKKFIKDYSLLLRPIEENTYLFNYMCNFSHLFSKLLLSITLKKVDCIDKYFDCKVIIKLNKVNLKTNN